MRNEELEMRNEECGMQNSFFGAKVLSKIAMVFAGIWIIVLTLLKGFGKVDLRIEEIIGSGVAVAAVWTPTYFSIIVDKFLRK